MAKESCAAFHAKPGPVRWEDAPSVRIEPRAEPDGIWPDWPHGSFPEYPPVDHCDAKEAP
jgi:hypothetical protein